MYKQNKMMATTINENKSTQGESLETKLERMIHNGEPMKDTTVPLIYTNRKDGVHPGTDIRTDRFKIAAEAIDKTTGDYQAKRANRWSPKKKEDGKPESTQGTQQSPTQ